MRALLAGLGLAVALATPSAARAQAHRQGCDPYSYHRRASPPPGTRAPRCGDGRVSTGRGDCYQICSGGCGTEGCGPVQCRTVTETCDGRDLAGQTCRSQGWAGGRLRCASSCRAFDASACRVCRAARGGRCEEGSLSAPVEGLALAAGPHGLGVLYREDAAVFARADARLRLGSTRRSFGQDVREAALVATDRGWLVATTSSSGVDVFAIDARQGLRVDAHHVQDEPAPSLSLTRSDDGQLVVLALGGPGARGRLRFFDAAGQPTVAPPRALRHGVGRGGHFLVAPLEPTPGGADTIAAWVDEARMVFAMFRQGRGFGGSAATGERLDLGLPGGDRLQMDERQATFLDANGRSRVFAATRPPPPAAERSLAAPDHAVRERAFAHGPDGIYAGALIQTGDERRLVLSRTPR